MLARGLSGIMRNKAQAQAHAVRNENAIVKFAMRLNGTPFPAQPDVIRQDAN